MILSINIRFNECWCSRGAFWKIYMQATYARYSKVTDIVTPETVNKIRCIKLKNNYEVNGYALLSNTFESMILSKIV